MHISEKAKIAPGQALVSIIVAYAVHSTDDERGRRGALIGVFTNRQAAMRANEKAGWYGGNGDLSEINVMTLADGRNFVLDGMIEFRELDINLVDDHKNRVAPARAKLTDAEAALLGLK